MSSTNGQASFWTDVDAGVPQGFKLGPLLIRIHINNLADGLLSNAELFGDETTIFCVHNGNNSAYELNNDLVKINKSAD